MSSRKVYAWMIALGSQSVAADLARALTKPANASLRRTFSLFKQGLTFFAEVLQRYSAYLGLLFIPDKRFI